MGLQSQTFDKSRQIRMADIQYQPKMKEKQNFLESSQYWVQMTPNKSETRWSSYLTRSGSQASANSWRSGDHSRTTTEKYLRRQLNVSKANTKARWRDTSQNQYHTLFP